MESIQQLSSVTPIPAGLSLQLSKGFHGQQQSLLANPVSNRIALLAGVLVRISFNHIKIQASHIPDIQQSVSA